MYLKIAKRLVAESIEAYKFRRFKNRFKHPLNARERALVLPFAYFVSHDEVHVIYDIGAAKGTFSSAVVKARNVEHVVAFEPLKTSYNVLVQNTRMSRSVRTFNLGLGNSKGRAEFFVTKDGDASSCLSPTTQHNLSYPDRQVSNMISIELDRLDTVQEREKLPFPDLLKIDTQGFELAVLSGAVNCLAQAKFCIIECSYTSLYDGGALIGEIYECFTDLGWRIAGAGNQNSDAQGRPLQIDLVFTKA